MTASTTRLNPSISSSTLPPPAAPAKLTLLPTYAARPVFRASTFAKRVAKSSDAGSVYSGVLRGWMGL